ncbi:Nuclease C1 [Diplonema papillatum]|nr:Nuclease C1 [Diplonema papillatum]|eukprot:gene15661-23906_t
MSRNAPLLFGLGCVTGGSFAVAITQLLSSKREPAPVPALPASVHIDPALSKWGIPSDEHLTVIGRSFVSSDNWRTRCPNWVLEYLTPDSLKGKAAREKSQFKAAPEVPEVFRATPKDYRDARTVGDFVRGHLVPAADMRGDQSAMDATFILNHNVVPQDSACNTGGWFHVESLARKVAKKHAESWILTGPMWLPEYNAVSRVKTVSYTVVGDHNIAVPSHLYKVILSRNAKGAISLGAFIVPNAPCDEPPLAYKVTLADVEAATGLQMFQFLDRKAAFDLCSVEKCTEKAKTFFAATRAPSELSDSDVEKA